MIEIATDRKTRDAFRSAHYQRSRAIGEFFGWLKRS